MSKAVAIELDIITQRTKPIIELGNRIRDLKSDIRGTNSPELLEMQLHDLSDEARALKDYPYKSGSFPQLMELIARAFAPPNSPADYDSKIIDYLADVVVESAKKSDITPAYVSARVSVLQELAEKHGIEIKADYI